VTRYFSMLIKERIWKKTLLLVQYIAQWRQQHDTLLAGITNTVVNIISISSKRNKHADSIRSSVYGDPVRA
jgi:hypothetical protein